ncbi:hypothetical protein, conserved [Plasmodium gonderi]|uniref:Uncharacterized protein n=1 Tax=Plasmodium gonderi TaxID=77519 RepID=A0A1Y1JM98_PLAGO|nr:hypothetical protein, conserved [Plasmodium gonderi]GAW82337.1 hypothetical protein, conserved [Plasmodium gonderi]
MSTLFRRRKENESILFIHGIYNREDEEKFNKKDKPGHAEASEKESGQARAEAPEQNCITSCENNGTIYERLCLGIRYFEMIILQKDEARKEKKQELLCLCGDNCLYKITDILEEISVFFLKNKKEKVFLSFMQYETNAENGYGNTDQHRVEELIDVYMYLYLRKKLKQHRGDSNYQILYFYNERERIINLEQYNFDIDHFEIRNWIFNNMAFMFPSKKVHMGEENPDICNSNLHYLKKHWNVTSEEEKENIHIPCDNETIKKKKKKRDENLLHLSQQHNISLFRLNSMRDNENLNLSSKITIIRRLPNILLDKNHSGEIPLCKAGNSKSIPVNTIAHISEDGYSRNNTVRHYMKCKNDNCKNVTVHWMDAYDVNLNSRKKFIGSNNLSLTEYVIDVPKQGKIQNSPFVFSKNKLVYLHDWKKLYKNEYKKKYYKYAKDSKYYVVKVQNGEETEELNKQSMHTFLMHFLASEDVKMGSTWICILTPNCTIRDVFNTVKFNFHPPGVQ